MNRKEIVQRLIDWSVRVGIVVIVLLLFATIAGVWNHSRIGDKAMRTKALAHAKQVHLALMEYEVAG
ncbi:MAG: hypothetical protein KDN22_31930 [Verrucomicrobiae bacterium]|nr:hypothetical protein [Verrucomicrobiae bacterium]